MLKWRHDAWEVRDLGSSNGTSVDGKRLARNVWAPLHAGSELRFAGGDLWVLVAALPPVAGAQSESGRVCVADQGLLVLPDWDAPVACIYEDADSLWWIEVGDEARIATDQETIVAGEPWVLSIPPPLSNTLESTTLRVERTLALDLVTLRFRHSQDLEHVDMSVVTDSGPLPPTSRAHQHVLLLLAKARVEDRAKGLPAQEQGWVYVDQLRAMLRIDSERLNVDIHRARKELAQLGVMDAGSIVERRPISRQIRLGTDRIEIESWS